MLPLLGLRSSLYCVKKPIYHATNIAAGGAKTDEFARKKDRYDGNRENKHKEKG
jgi:hypothetical protein